MGAQRRTSKSGSRGGSSREWREEEGWAIWGNYWRRTSSTVTHSLRAVEMLHDSALYEFDWHLTFHIVSFWPDLIILLNGFHLLSYYAALLPRRGPHIASHSVCPSVCLSVPLSLPSVTWRHLANYNDTPFRHAQRAAYRTAISAAQTCFSFFLFRVVR